MTNNTMLATNLYRLLINTKEFDEISFSYTEEEAKLIHYIYPKYFCYTSPQICQYHITTNTASYVDIDRSHIIHKLEKEFGLNEPTIKQNFLNVSLLYKFLNTNIEYTKLHFIFSKEETDLIKLVYPEYYVLASLVVLRGYFVREKDNSNLQRAYVIHKLEEEFGLNESKLESNQKTKPNIKQEVNLEEFGLNESKLESNQKTKPDIKQEVKLDSSKPNAELLNLLVTRIQIESNECDKYWFTDEETNLIIDLEVIPKPNKVYAINSNKTYGYNISDFSCHIFTVDEIIDTLRMRVSVKANTRSKKDLLDILIHSTFYDINSRYFTKEEARSIIFFYPDYRSEKELYTKAYFISKCVLDFTRQEIITMIQNEKESEDLKYDKEKPIAGVLQDFSFALYELAKLMTYGAKKYERGSWQEVENGQERYTDAFFRHILQEKTEIIDPETEIHHDIATLFNDLARIELRLREEKTNNG